MRLEEAKCVHCGELSHRPVNPEGNWLCLICGRAQGETAQSISKRETNPPAPFPQLEFEL